MSDVLLSGDTVWLPELRLEIPVDIGDQFLYVEVGRRRIVNRSSSRAT